MDEDDSVVALAAHPSPAALKPCPFCGKEMERDPSPLHKWQTWAMRHPKNGCLLSGYGWGLVTHADRWNARAAVQDEMSAAVPTDAT